MTMLTGILPLQMRTMKPIRNSLETIWILLLILSTMTDAGEDRGQLPRAMDQFFKRHVEYDQPLMTENKRIAESFVQDVKEMLAENVKDLPLSVGGYERQGSAFEGLKVGTPDEFDFAIQYRVNKKAGELVYVEGTTIGPSLPDNAKAAGYWKIELKSTDKADVWSKFTDNWPGTSKPCLSPRKLVQRVQSALDKFLGDMLTQGMAAMSMGDRAASASGKGEWRRWVREIKRKPKGNPALTMRLTKNNGGFVDVDISPCIIDSQQRHFVPKRHPILNGRPINPENPFEMLWMRTESQKELKTISSIDQDGGERRKCMRVLKGALASKDTPFTQFHSSYIVKTAWLHTVDKFPGKDRWKGWEVLSLRLADILTKLETAFRERKLFSRFNKNENILARFNEPFLKSCEGFLKSLNNKLSSGQIKLFIHDLGLDGSGLGMTMQSVGRDSRTGQEL